MYNRTVLAEADESLRNTQRLADESGTLFCHALLSVNCGAPHATSLSPAPLHLAFSPSFPLEQIGLQTMGHLGDQRESLVRVSGRVCREIWDCSSHGLLLLLTLRLPSLIALQINSMDANLSRSNKILNSMARRYGSEPSRVRVGSMPSCFLRVGSMSCCFRQRKPLLS